MNLENYYAQEPERPPLRKCGIMEDIMNKSGMTCVGITIGYKKTEVHEKAMKMAWFLCRNKHPYLKVKIRNGELHQAKELSEVTFIKSDDIDAEIDRFASANVAINRDPAPNDLCIVSSSNIASTPNMICIMIRKLHSLSDGTSETLLVNDLLEFYDRLLQGEELEVTQEPFLSSSDNIGFKLGRGSPYTSFAEKMHQERIGMKVMIPYDKDMIYTAGGTKSGFIRGKGTSQGLQNLLSFCRVQGVTISNVIQAAMSFVTAKLNNTTDLSTFSINADVNLRNEFAEPMGARHVACLIGSVSLYPRPTGKTSFLELSRQMRQEMGHALENKHQFLCQKFNAEFDWNSAEWGNATRRNHNHGGTIKFENIGKYRYGTSHKLLDITEQYTCGQNWTPDCGPYALTVNCVNQLCFTMVYEDVSDINKHTAQQFTNHLIDIVENIEKFHNLTMADFVASYDQCIL